MRHSFFTRCVIFCFCVCMAPAQSSGTFTATGSMTTARSGHTATLLPNGKALIAGGFTSSSFGPTRSAELYDPSTGSFTPTGSMITARYSHTATLLSDGTVLIAGGFGPTVNSATASAELYDPRSGTFNALGDVSRVANQALHTATLLWNGKVLLAGIGANAELYDPATRTFADTGPYADPSPGFVDTATLLPDGSVLMTGCTPGCLTGVTQVYNPGTDTFRALKPECRCWYNINTATLLTDGNVLFVGSDEYDEPADAEVYDRSTGTFTGVGNTTAPHEFSTATLLPDGTVLIAGSQLPGGSGDSSVDVYDPVSARLAFLGNMTVRRHGHTATLLPDGTVLIAGGNSTWPDPTSATEIYRPAVLTPSPVLYSLAGAAQGAIWHGSTGEVASPSNPAVAGEVLSMYTTNLIDNAVIPPQVAVAGRFAEVLYFGDAPGYPGYSQVNFRVPEGVAAGPNVSVRLMYLGRSSNEVTIGVR